MISTVHNDLIFSPLLYLQTQIYEMIFSRSQSCPMVRSMQQAMEAKPTLFLNTLITATLTKVRSEGIKILKIRKKKLQKVIDGYFKSSNKVWLNSCKVLNFKLSYLWLFINHLIIKTFMMLLFCFQAAQFFPSFSKSSPRWLFSVSPSSQFLYALPQKEGYEFFVGQWSRHELHFTSLINVQVKCFRLTTPWHASGKGHYSLDSGACETRLYRVIPSGTFPLVFLTIKDGKRVFILFFYIFEISNYVFWKWVDLFMLGYLQ